MLLALALEGFGLVQLPSFIVGPDSRLAGWLQS
jgi:hypothetical protein